MSLTIEFHGTFNPTGRKILDRILSKYAKLTFTHIAEVLQKKSIENASGETLPEIVSEQGSRIGSSASGYTPTGYLANITNTMTGDGYNFTAYIVSPAEYAPWVEFGTGVFRGGKPIYPKDSPFLQFMFQGNIIRVRFILGQRPKPFMRSAIWYVQQNSDKLGIST